MARVLIIEDNPDNLELVTYLLEAYGHEISTADNGELGIEAVRREQPDIVLCDIHLPGVDGYAVARSLKSDASTRDIPLLAVTALAMVGDSDKVSAAGFDGYITKPIEPENFVTQVDRYLGEGQRGALPSGRQAEASVNVETSRAVRETLIVVDDTPMNQELIYQTLTPFGYDVRLASDVESAFELARAAPPDLILSDLHMPGADGFEFVRRLKADPQLASIPFIFISSSVWGEQDRETALALGVERFLLRPIEPQALIDEITACLFARRMVRDGHDPRR